MPRPTKPTPEEKTQAADEAASARRTELEVQGEYVSPTAPPLLDEDQKQMARLAQEALGEALTDEARADLEAMLDAESGMRPALEYVEDASLRAQIRAAGTGGSTLHRKLAEIAGIAHRIPKNGTAPREMGGYKFVQVGDAADWLRPELAKRGLTMLPVFINQVGDIERAGRDDRLIIQTVKTTWRITDAETGEYIDIESMGTGGDTGDKSSPKAQTNALKYAILMAFQLSTGDDPEASNLEPPADAPIVIGDSNLTGIRQGGRQDGATQTQIDRIRQEAARVQITPEALGTLIAAQLGGRAPDIDSLDNVQEKQRALIDFIGGLTFTEAGGILRALMDAPVGDPTE